MAYGKSIKKSSFYGSGEMGGAPDIAMPNHNEKTILDEPGSDPWGNSRPHQSPPVINNMFDVPSELPKEVMEEMNQGQDQKSQEETIAQEQIVESSEKSQSIDNLSRVTKPTPQDSFKAMREAKEKAERESELTRREMQEFKRQLAEYQAAQQQYSKPKEQPIDDNIDFNIDDDSLVEAKHVKKVAQKLKALESQINEHKQYASQNIVESRIKSQFPDFEKVVSPENVRLLNEQFPEIAQVLKDTNDLYSKAASAYSVMKQYGIHKEDIYIEDKARAIANAQKPKPLASMSPQQGDSPLSKANAFANGLTDDLKKQLRQEMLAARKSI